jgi:hypothetical protein
MRNFPSALEREAMNFEGATPVTRVTVMTARCGARRVALPLIGGLIALSLAACETSSNNSGAAVSSTLASPQQAKSKPIAFAPVIGAPAKVSSKMNELLVASAGQKNIPIAAAKDAEYTVRGYLVAAADAKGTKFSYIWDITDKGGKRAKRIQGDELIEGKKGGDPWALVDEAVMQRVALKTADDLIAWMPADGAPPTTASTSEAAQPASQAESQPAEQRVSRSREPEENVLAVQQPEATAAAQPAAVRGSAIAMVPPVTGAPGDGEASLTAAMRRHLEQAGVKLIEGSDPTAYTVRGSVQLGTPDGGQQPITIRWLVVDPTGKTMEKAVVQRNKVPEGSLNGSWGQVADLAAGEAARSVAKLIKPAG